jgi:(p)ppGpp synthase/HD superfamily hydrolase
MALSPRFEEALVYAARLHADQLRKGSPIPYVAHLMGTASIVLEYEGSEDEAIAALLHDAVEDQGGDPTLQEIRRRFGETVAEIVVGCTDSWTIPKPPWQERKEACLKHLPQSSPSILLVSCADKLYNARSTLKDYREMGEDLWPRFRGGKQGTLWYFRALVGAFRKNGHAALVDELDRVITELETLSKFPPA